MKTLSNASRQLILDCTRNLLHSLGRFEAEEKLTSEIRDGDFSVLISLQNCGKNAKEVHRSAGMGLELLYSR